MNQKQYVYFGLWAMYNQCPGSRRFPIFSLKAAEITFRLRNSGMMRLVESNGAVLEIVTSRKKPSFQIFAVQLRKYLESPTWEHLTGITYERLVLN